MSDASTPPELPEARASDSFVPFPLDVVQRVELGTTSAVEDEIFASLNFVSDIKDVGVDFVTRLTGKKGNEAERSHQLFQAFVRQGQAFFQSAERLHYRASPLFYYYCFLNFAKAYICLRRPEVFSGKIRHGVFHDYDPNKGFAEQIVTITANGVFPLFYELIVGTKLPNGFHLSVPDLLGYMSDIQFEYEHAGYGAHKLLPVKCRGLVKNVSESASETWAVVAVHKFEMLESCPNAVGSFLQCFEEVALKKYLCERVFGISAPERLGFRFFQSKQTMTIDQTGTPVGDLLSPSRKAVEMIYMPSVFRSEFDFFFSLPIADDLRLNFDELFAGYLIFFYLGDLVRYHPDYLEKILYSKESWIIQRFTRSCATTLLKRMTLLLLGENRVYSPR
jgi:hypothetical protein